MTILQAAKSPLYDIRPPLDAGGTRIASRILDDIIPVRPSRSCRVTNGVPRLDAPRSTPAGFRDPHVAHACVAKVDAVGGAVGVGKGAEGVGVAGGLVEAADVTGERGVGGRIGRAGG